MREVKLMKYHEDYYENYDDEHYGEEYRGNEDCDERQEDGYDTDEEMYVYD